MKTIACIIVIFQQHILMCVWSEEEMFSKVKLKCITMENGIQFVGHGLVKMLLLFAENWATSKYNS